MLCLYSSSFTRSFSRCTLLTPIKLNDLTETSPFSRVGQKGVSRAQAGHTPSTGSAEEFPTILNLLLCVCAYTWARVPVDTGCGCQYVFFIPSPTSVLRQGLSLNQELLFWLYWLARKPGIWLASLCLLYCCNYKCTSPCLAFDVGVRDSKSEFYHTHWAIFLIPAYSVFWCH